MVIVNFGRARPGIHDIDMELLVTNIIVTDGKHALEL